MLSTPPLAGVEAEQERRANGAAALTSTGCEIINAVIFYKKQFPERTSHYLNPPERQQLKEADL